MSDGLFKCLFDDHNRVAEQLHEMGWRAPNDAQWSKLKIWCEGISLDWELMSLSRDASRHDASDLRSKLAVAVEALEGIAKKSMCPCWIVPGMGSGQDYKWKGCEPHLSDDPMEYCICCEAHEALAKIRGEK